MFIQQQAALETAAAQSPWSDSSLHATMPQQPPAAHSKAARDAASSTANIAAVKAGGGGTGRSSAALATADSTAAKAVPVAQDEVFSRLYEAAQASLRRKEAYAKAATAAELASLQSASAHALPLPAGL